MYVLCAYVVYVCMLCMFVCVYLCCLCYLCYVYFLFLPPLPYISTYISYLYILKGGYICMGQVFCVCVLKGGVSDSFDLDQRCFWFPLESWCRDGFCEQIER